MKDAKIVLASASPRRKMLLREVVDDFELYAADIDESLIEGEGPREHTERLAILKAKAALKAFPNAIIIGSDTIVVIDGEILGKPASSDEARGMLRRLSGRTHSVFTAYCVLDGESGRLEVKSVESKVTIRALKDEEIAEYVATGEPLDKAGSYAVQGIGARLVSDVEGSYTNVVGLPIEELGKSIEALIRAS